MIRARLGFSRRSDGDISIRAHAVKDGTYRNPTYFPKPPVPFEDFNTALENFDLAVAGTLDRGRRAFAEKRSCRKILVDMLMEVGHYVEAASKDDIEAFGKSGFEPVSGRGATTESPVPRIARITQGQIGELIASVTPLYRKVVHYQLRKGVAGTSPDTWPIQNLLQAKRPVRVQNLTPGTVYAFQVRALGKNGDYTEWSPIATRMCI
jgi:hypothetical protein